MKTAPEEKRYLSVERQIANLIENGTLRPGERIPSVRRLSRQREVSISTVLHAYSLLESKGFIEARPQSGYFVRPRLWRPPEEPAMSPATRHPVEVNMSRLAMQVIQAIREPGLIGLGAALPSPELLPTAQLTRAMAAAARRAPVAASAYDAPPGHLGLRTQVARHAVDGGCSLSPSEIVTTCGGTEALHLALSAVASPGDTIAIETPTYYGILQCIEALGMKALEIPTHPRDGVSLEALALALETQPVKACLFMPNFSNPLGCAMPDEAKRRLVAMLAEREIPLIEDDMYGEVAFAPERPRMAKAYDTKGLVILCGSFSKTLAPGYRVGWIAAGRYQQEVERFKMITSLATPTPPQMAIADYLATGGYDHHIRKIRRLYAEKVERVTRAIAEHFPEGTRVTRPSGGQVVWVELPEVVDSLLLFRRALAEKISIAPGPIFSAKQKFRNFIRLNCGNPWSDALEQAFQRLGQLIGEQVDAGAALR